MNRGFWLPKATTPPPPAPPPPPLPPSLRLTDAEREAIKTVIGGFGMWVAQNALTDDESLRLAVVTLRNLLERLK